MLYLPACETELFWADEQLLCSYLMLLVFAMIIITLIIKEIID